MLVQCLPRPPAVSKKPLAPTNAPPGSAEASKVLSGGHTPTPPLGVSSLLLARVHRQVHRLRVEQVDPVVGGLQVAGALRVAALEDVEALPKEVAGGVGHL